MLTFQILTEDDDSAERVIVKTLSVMESAIELNQMWLRRHPEDVCFLTCGEINYDFARETTLSDIIPIKTIPILEEDAHRAVHISFVAFDVAVRRMIGEEAEPYVSSTEKYGVFHITTAVKGPGGTVHIDPTKEIINEGSYLSAPSICKC